MDEGYYLVSHTGGIATWKQGETISWPDEFPDTNKNGKGGDGSSSPYVGVGYAYDACYAHGPTEAKYRWYSKWGNPAPNQVVVTESYKVYLEGITQGEPSFTCDDGLAQDDPIVGNSYPVNDDGAIWYTNQSSHGTRETVHPGGREVTIIGKPVVSVANNLYGYAVAEENQSVTVPLVSGTNCKYTFRKPDDFTGSIQHITITCNGEAIFDGVSIGGGTTASPNGCHYDSTHFPDKTPVKFHTVATSTEIDSNGNSKTFKCDDIYLAYNKYSALYMNSAGFEDSASETIPDDFKEMRHGNADDANPSDDTSKRNYTKEAFLKQLPIATAFHLSVHGGPVSFSRTGKPVDPDRVRLADITEAMKKRVTVPSINLVLMAACSTLAKDKTTGQNSTAMPTAFGISGDDRAYAGFDADLPASANIKNPADGVIMNIGEFFWEQIRKGWTVASAVKVCNRLYHQSPLFQNAPANMLSVGDGKTTLHGLYVAVTHVAGEDADVAIPDAPWFKLDGQQ